METIPPIVERIVEMLTTTQRDIAAMLREVHAGTQRIEESAERIAQMTAEVLRRVPEQQGDTHDC